MEMKEGFYILKGTELEDTVLTHGYYCSDMNNAFVFGFNTHDGGGLIPLDDLSLSTTYHAVDIPELR